METSGIVQLVGYAGSLLVGISLTMSSILRLRVINLVGAATFATYGALTGAYPVLCLNGFIVLVDIYYLWKMFGTKAYFKLLEMQQPSDYFRYFLSFWEPQIRASQPDFRFEPTERTLIFFVLRDLIPIGLFIGELRDGGVLEVKLDFVIPGYRDFKSGRFLFREQAELFRARGIDRIVSAPGDARHARYLRKMGFVPELPADPQTRYVRALG